jgi:Na+/H+ antiporter NhaD/arsenite permease-like protein
MAVFAHWKILSAWVVFFVTNLIVVEKARNKVSINFWTYTRVGLPVTALTLGAGLIYWWLIGP